MPAKPRGRKPPQKQATTARATLTTLKRSSKPAAPKGPKVTTASTATPARVPGRAPAAATGGPRLAMEHDVTSMTFSGDCRLLAAADTKGAIAWFDTTTGARLGRITTVARDFVKALAFTPGDRTLIGGTKQLQEIDVENGKVTRPIGSPVKWAVSSLAFSPDGTRLALADVRDALAVVDMATGKERWRGKLERHASLVFLDAATLLSIDTSFLKLHRWDVSTFPVKPLPTEDGTTNRLVPLARDLVGIGPHRGLGKPRDLVIYDHPSVTEKRRLPDATINDAVVSDGRNRVAYFTAAGKGDVIAVLDVASGRTTTFARKARYNALAMAADGRVAASIGKTIVLFDRTGNVIIG